MRISARLSIVALLAVASGPAAAQPFYEGKTISLMVGLAPGGGYDLYARYLARHFAKHIPGNPRVIVENKPGAATATATTFIYNSAPKDGTVLGMSLDILPLYQTLFPERLNFDMSKVQWIGNMATLNSVIAVSDRSPVKTVADMTKATAALGSNGVLSQTYIVPALLNAFHGAKFKIVLGFQGTAQMDLAIERGEIDGRGGQWTSFAVGRADWVKQGKIMPLIQIGTEDDPQLKGAPQLSSLATNDQQRAIYAILSAMPRLSRAFWVAPGVPADRVEILRKAFDNAMKDPALLADTAKANIEITPTTHSDVQKTVAELAATPSQHLDVLRNILREPTGNTGKK
jgi:tripartite-type tricarboxylate transporter receptor subunit TctC